MNYAQKFDSMAVAAGQVISLITDFQDRLLNPLIKH